MPQRKVRSDAARCRSRRTLQGILRGQRRPRSFHHHGFRRHAPQDAQGPRNRQARRSHRSRRSPHLRHGIPLPHRRHLFQRRPELRARRRQHAALLQGSQERPDPRRGHHRSRLDGFIHRRGLRLRHPRHQHHSVLHLLFDVRFSAHRRFHLGRRRYAHARLPPRRHCRPHHARRRRPPAPGRQQPRPRASCSESSRLRSRVTPTKSPSSFRTAFAACTRMAKTSSTTSPS